MKVMQQTAMAPAVREDAVRLARGQFFGEGRAPEQPVGLEAGGRRTGRRVFMM